MAARIAGHVVIQLVNTQGEDSRAQGNSRVCPPCLRGRVCEQWRLGLVVLATAAIVATLILYVITQDHNYLYVALGIGVLTASFLMYVAYQYPFSADMRQTASVLEQQLRGQQQLADMQRSDLTTQRLLTASQGEDLRQLDAQLQTQRDLNAKQKANLDKLDAALELERQIVKDQTLTLSQLSIQLKAAVQLTKLQKENLTKLEADLAKQSQDIESMLKVTQGLREKLQQLDALTTQTKGTGVKLNEIEHALEIDEQRLHQLQQDFQAELTNLIREQTKFQQEQQAFEAEVQSLKEERNQIQAEHDAFLRNLRQQQKQSATV